MNKSKEQVCTVKDIQVKISSEAYKPPNLTDVIYPGSAPWVGHFQSTEQYVIAYTTWSQKNVEYQKAITDNATRIGDSISEFTEDMVAVLMRRYKISREQSLDIYSVIQRFAVTDSGYYNNMLAVYQILDKRILSKVYKTNED